MVIIIICYENISIYLIKINYFIGFVCFYALIIILISCTSLYSFHNFYKNNHETLILENKTKKPNRLWVCLECFIGIYYIYNILFSLINTYLYFIIL